MHKKRWTMYALALLVALSTLVSLVSCGPQPTAAPTEAPEETQEEEVSEAEMEPIKVGWFGALTGDWALWGEASRNGTLFTMEQINDAGGVLGGRKFELIAYDNKSDQLESVNVVKRLITEDNVVAVIGTNSSGSNIAVAPIGEENKVPIIATYATNPRVTQPEEGVLMQYTFRVCFTDPYQGSVMANFAYNDLQARKAAVLYEISSDYSVGLRDFFVQRWEELGGELVADEAFKTGDVEFRAQLTSIKDAEPDVIIMPFLAKEVALAAKQARDLGITVPFIGGDGWPSPTLLEMAASAVEGCYFVDHTNVNAENVQEYRQAYEERFGKDIQVNAIMTHDAVLVLAAAIEKAGSADPEKIRDALENLDPVPGFTGNITIDPETHNPVGKSAVIMTIKDGQFEFYKVLEPMESTAEAAEEEPAAEMEPIKVGWFGALTGDWALWGEASRNGTLFTMEQINEAGGVLGGRKFELIAYDNKSDQLESVNVVKRLITEDNVVAVIGTNSSGSNIAVAPIGEENKVPIIATYATNPRVTQPEEGVLMEYTFRVCFTDPYQGSVIANFAYNDLQARKAAVLYEISSDYSVGLRDFFVQRWEELGGELVADEAFKTGDVEFRAQLTSIKDAEPDVIVMPFLAKEVALAAKQARDLGITVPFIGGDGWPSPTLLEMAASAVEGCYFVDHTNVNAENVQEYRQAYEERFGKDIQVNAIMTHDAVLVLAAAIEKAGSADPEKIRDALESLDPVPGFTGNITIDPETHNPVGKSAVIMTIKDGQFEFYTVVEPMQ